MCHLAVSTLDMFERIIREATMEMLSCHSFCDEDGATMCYVEHVCEGQAGWGTLLPQSGFVL